MNKYKVNVNGNSYEVEIELVDDFSKEASAPSNQEKQSAPIVAGANVLNAPMPGTILAVNISAGQSVKKGDVLFILEAMKMENEISAPFDATVDQISVKKGDAVESGTVLCSFN